jgi:hypothetical protein
LVLCEEIRRDALEVLARPELGSLHPEVVDSVLGPVWRAAFFVEPVPDDPQYVAVVRDPDDVIVLRTAMAAYLYPDELGSGQRKFIVSGDTRAFPPGRRWAEWEYRVASEFWSDLCAASRDA